MIHHKYQGECCTGPPCYRSLIPTSYFSNMKGGLIEINSGVSSLMMAWLVRRLPPLRSRWSAVCQTLQQREELIKLGWVVTEEGGGLTQIYGRLGGGLPAAGLLEACQIVVRHLGALELAAQFHLCGLVFCLRERSYRGRLRLPAVVLKSAHSGGGYWRAAGGRSWFWIRPQPREMLTKLARWRACTRSQTQILTLLKEMSALREYS